MKNGTDVLHLYLLHQPLAQFTGIFQVYVVVLFA